MQDLKITSVQCDLVWENKQENLNRFDVIFDKIHSTDLVVLPEMFNTGFSMRSKELAEEFKNSESIQWLVSKAKQKKVAIYTTLMIKENSKFFNRGVFVFPDGEITHYDKIKLFSMSGENKSFTPGSEATIVTYKGWKIKLQICYDLRFPEIARNYPKNGDSQYDLIIYTANWPAKRISHWEVLLQARAIENQSYVLGVNRIGIDGNELHYSGNSRLIDANGEKDTVALDIENCTTFCLSHSELEDLRSKLPFLNDSIALN
ncbi:MAG: nitrilase family protein [Bacteroidetes bacterium]|nr:nitrilase family protein [Bacteroidota bacterium]